jgi:hypothetical protein
MFGATTHTHNGLVEISLLKIIQFKLLSVKIKGTEKEDI